MLLACEHDLATGHFSIGAANAPSGAIAAANKLNHEMSMRVWIIFMIFSQKLLIERTIGVWNSDHATNKIAKSLSRCTRD